VTSSSPHPANTTSRVRPVAAVRALLVLCVSLVVSGSHWDVLQVAAWARMFTNNLQTESVVAALGDTFSPDQLCGVCEVVQTARQDQDQETAALVRVYEKSPLLPVESVATLIAPPRVSHVLRAARARCPSAWTVATPVPPPRASV